MAFGFNVWTCNRLLFAVTAFLYDVVFRFLYLWVFKVTFYVNLVAQEASIKVISEINEKNIKIRKLHMFWYIKNSNSNSSSDLSLLVKIVNRVWKTIFYTCRLTTNMKCAIAHTVNRESLIN